MLQTDSAGALLTGPAMDKPSAKVNKPYGDGDGFSQEFEKQVNKANSPGQESEQKHAHTESDEVSGKAANHGGDSDGKSLHKADNAAKKHPQQTEGKERKSEGDETEAAESGKKLPQQVAAELADAEKLQSEADKGQGKAASAGGQAEEQLASVMMKNKDKSKSVDALLKEEQKKDGEATEAVLPFMVQAPSDGTKGIAGSQASAGEEALGLTQLSLRDVLSQRLAGGGSHGENAAGRQGKMDMNALISMQIGQGRAQQGGFDEALKLSATAMSGAQQQAPTLAAQPAAASVPVAMTLALPVQQQGWDKAMAERVVWMARGNIQQAQIQLNPRDLGPIDIKVSMQHDQTHVNFVAHHVATRDAIEAALPRLREMMSEQGLNLGQADVSQHSFGDSSRQAAETGGGNGQASGAQAGGEEEVVDEGLVTRHVGHVSASGVDYFA